MIINIAIKTIPNSTIIISIAIMIILIIFEGGNVGCQRKDQGSCCSNRQDNFDDNGDDDALDDYDDDDNLDHNDDDDNFEDDNVFNDNFHIRDCPSSDPVCSENGYCQCKDYKVLFIQQISYGT